MTKWLSVKNEERTKANLRYHLLPKLVAYNPSKTSRELGEEMGVSASVVGAWLKDEQVIAAINREKAKILARYTRTRKINLDYIVDKTLKGIARIEQNKKAFDSRGYFTGLAFLARVTGLDNEYRSKIEAKEYIESADTSKLSEDEMRKFLELSNKIIKKSENEKTLEVDITEVEAEETENDEP